MPTPPPTPEAYVLHLEPVPDPVLRRTPLARLKALLKAALRGYGLKAVLLKPTTDTINPKDL